MSEDSYPTWYDDESYSFMCPHEIYIACCDCGLVHLFKFKIRDGKEVMLKLKRDDRRTAQLRRRKDTGLQQKPGNWKMIRNGRKKRYVKSRKK